MLSDGEEGSMFTVRSLEEVSCVDWRSRSL